MGVKSGRARAKRSLDKAFDGWQLGLATILFAWAVVMVIVPRPTTPLEIPAPMPAPVELDALRDLERAREARALVDLPPPLRAIGSAVRAVGRAEWDHDGAAASRARQAISAATAGAVHVPAEPVLELRALQTASFVRAVRDFERSDIASRDLIELGGGLVAAFREAGWASDEDGRLVVALDDDELGAAYRKRWNELVSLNPSAAATTLTEERLLFASAIRRARSPLSTSAPGSSRPVGVRAILRRIDDYARVDAAYPADYARGVAHFGAGAFGKAHVAFSAHLDAHPDGPLTLRARNFARAALFADAEGFAP